MPSLTFHRGQLIPLHAILILAPDIANPCFTLIQNDFLPVGIDIRKVLSTGISPVIHGGMFNKEGGLIGAGMARIPMECFEKAMAAFVKKYGA